MLNRNSWITLMQLYRTLAFAGIASVALSSAALAAYPDCIAPAGNSALKPDSAGQYPSNPANPYDGDHTVWSTDGVEIHVSVNGGETKQFFATGMNYEPTQIGGSADYSPFNDFFYTNDTNLWKPLWKRDLDLMRDMGVNSIRTYGFWKWEPGFVSGGGGSDGVAPHWRDLDFSADTASENNKQFCLDGDTSVFALQHPTHIPFLDKLWNDGKRPIYVWIGVSLPLDLVLPGTPPARRENLRQFYRYTAQWLAKKYGNHPAVMGFVIGNEIDTDLTTPTSEFWETINDLHRLIKASAPDKLTMNTFHDTADYNRPITVGAFKGKKGPEVYELDVWGFNPYRNPEGLFADFRKNVIKCDSGDCTKPLLYGEFGAPADTHDVTDEPYGIYPNPWVGTNFIWQDNPPAAQCLARSKLQSPPGSGGAGADIEGQTRRTIAIELPAGRGDRVDMPKNLAEHFADAGVKAGDDLPAADQAKWYYEFWKVTLSHKADNDSLARETDFASGGFLFEWRDEWWKSDYPTFQNISGRNTCTSCPATNCDTGAANVVFPGGWGDEEWFGINGAKPSGRKATDPVVNQNGKLNGGPDILLPRAAVASVCQMYGKCLLPTELAKVRALKKQDDLTRKEVRKAKKKIAKKRLKKWIALD